MKKLGIFVAGAVVGGVTVVVSEAVWLTSKVKQMTAEGLKTAEEITEILGDDSKMEQIKKNAQQQMKNLDNATRKKVIERLNTIIETANDMKDKISKEDEEA